MWLCSGVVSDSVVHSLIYGKTQIDRSSSFEIFVSYINDEIKSEYCSLMSIESLSFFFLLYYQVVLQFGRVYPNLMRCKCTLNLRMWKNKLMRATHCLYSSWALPSCAWHWCFWSKVQYCFTWSRYVHLYSSLREGKKTYGLAWFNRKAAVWSWAEWSCVKWWRGRAAQRREGYSSGVILAQHKETGDFLGDYPTIPLKNS